MKITDKTAITGSFNSTVDDLLRPFADSKELQYAKRLAPMYIKFGSKFGIRADIAFAQMCHETGLLKFSGIAKPDWNNFCGLGVTGPRAVQKFLTEDHGVVAHYAHLSWYVFPDHKNSMCTREFDPRHFETPGKHHPKFNGDVTLKRLNGSWAVPGLTYATKIAHYANIINGNKEEVKVESKPESDIKSELETRKEFNFKSPTSMLYGADKVKSVSDDKLDIIVQMGHVGRKRGATGAYKEREWTEKLGNAMKPLLKASGLKYRIMGADNWLKPKPNKAKIFFALHYDGSPNKNAKGFSCGFPLGTNQRFKDAMAMSYKAFSGFNQRPDNYTKGLKRYYAWTLSGKRKIQHVEADFYCLLEHGFGSNDIEREWMFGHINAIAKHHIEVIERFLADVKG